MARANPNIIMKLANRTKCTQCKHRKDEGHILPKGEYSPSPSWLFHYEDTHGLPHYILQEWIYLSAYEENDNNLLLEKWGGLLENTT